MNDRIITDIIAGHGTSAYIFEIEAFAKRAALIRKYLGGDTGLCYAMKANPFLVGSVSNLIDRIEVCSPGEYEICMAQGVAPEKLIVSGVNKTETSMRRILTLSGGKGIFTLESENHYDILSRLTAEMKLTITVLVRLSSGNQFGVDEKTLISLLSRVKDDPHMELSGVHYFSGTQKKKAKIERELARLNDLSDVLAERFPVETLELEYGPGLSVSYFQNDSEKELSEADPEKQLSVLAENLAKLREKGYYKHITVELGRFLAAECGTYVTRAVDVKRMEHGNFVIVDGGIHQLSYYGQMMGMKLPHMQVLHKKDTGYECESITSDTEGKQSFIICGSLCSINDVMIRDLPASDLNEEDLLVFERCGAYSMTEGIALFLSRELPHIFIREQDGTLVHKRALTEINYLNGGS